MYLTKNNSEAITLNIKYLVKITYKVGLNSYIYMPTL